MIGQSITKNGIMLGLFAIVVAVSLAATELVTREQREASLLRVQYMALEEIIPPEQHDNNMLEDAITVSDTEYLKLKEPETIHIARKDGEVFAFIIPTTAPDAYSGSVQSIVGIYLDGTVAGVRVIQHQETPGLGDKVELKKSPWVLGFEGKSLSNPDPENWKVKKDKGVFDQFTGATITPRAVLKSIYNALLYFRENREALLVKATEITLEDKENTEQDTDPKTPGDQQ